MSFAKFYHSLIFQFPMYLEPLAPRQANISGKDQPLVPIFWGNWKMRDYRFPPKKTTRGTNMDLEETHSEPFWGLTGATVSGGCSAQVFSSQKCAEPLLPRSTTSYDIQNLHDVQGNPRLPPTQCRKTRPYLRPYFGMMVVHKIHNPLTRPAISFGKWLGEDTLGFPHGKFAVQPRHFRGAVNVMVFISAATLCTKTRLRLQPRLHPFFCRAKRLRETLYERHCYLRISEIHQMRPFQRTLPSKLRSSY